MSKVNILVVDDRPEGILAVQAVLNSPTYNIMTASSGHEALKKLLQYDFAVILLDVQMPIMNGFETASLIKTREKSKDIPIVFMSAINQDEQYVYQGYDVGAVDYLLKPFDPHILRSKVAIFVDIFRKKELIKEQAHKLYLAEQKSHAEKLNQIELENLRRYQNLADSIPQIVFRLGKDGDSEYFNRVWFDYTGLTEASSQNLLWQKVIHPDDFKAIQDSAPILLAEKSLATECRILNRFGVFRWHLLRFQAEHIDDAGEVTTWLGTATDIEDRKVEEETQKFFARMGEILVSTLNDRHLFKNVSEYIVPEMGDWCAFDILTSDGVLENIALTHKNPKKTQETKKAYSEFLLDAPLESKVRFVNHSVMDKVSVGTSFIILPLLVSNEPVGTMTIASEIGQKEDSFNMTLAEEISRRVSQAYENSKLYRISQEAIQVRNDFLSIASHELNTPITSLKLQLQMVQKNLEKKGGEFPVERFSKSVEASVKQVDRLINLIQILLDVSRIQSGRFSFDLEKLHPLAIVKEVIERHREVLEHSGCQVNVNVPDELEVIWDKTRIEQVITNLLTNAIKYAPGVIDIIICDENENVCIEVKDHGKGIPDGKIKTIFDRFERATSNDSISGLGLGLFIVKQIIEGHHGTVVVKSDKEQGTTFTVHLPKDVSAVIDSTQLDSSLDDAHMH